MGSGLTLDEKVRVVRRVLDAYASQDLDLLLQQVHPNVEWIPPIALAEGKAFHGHAGIREWWVDLISTFDGFRTEVDETHQVGDQLLTLGRILSRGKSSTIEISDEVGWVWEFRDGRISAMRVYLGHAQALEAVGRG